MQIFTRIVIRRYAAILVAAGAMSVGPRAMPDAPLRAETVEDPGAPAEGFATARTDTFLLIHRMGEDWSMRTGLMLETFRELFTDAFRANHYDVRPPDGPLEWLCFDERSDFDRYVAKADRVSLDHLREYYSSRTNRVAIVRLGIQEGISVQVGVDSASTVDAAGVDAYVAPRGTLAAPVVYDDMTRRLAHEAAHQLAFNIGLQRRGVMYPFWVSEGLACASEMLLVGGGPGKDNAMRQASLERARMQGRLMSLERFVELSDLNAVPADERESMYAQAWSLFDFLWRERPNELRRYLRELAEGPEGRRSEKTFSHSFSSAFGPLEKIQREWLADGAR